MYAPYGMFSETNKKTRFQAKDERVMKGNLFQEILLNKGKEGKKFQRKNTKAEFFYIFFIHIF